jgi:hypothetical protein
VANDRDSSKQKRARQNRAQREAREARAKAASIPAEERKAKYASGTPADAASTKKDRSAGRPRPERKPRLGDTPVDLETLQGNWYTKRLAVPGGRQVLTGSVLTVVITVLTVVTKYPDPDATGEAKKKATESFFDIYGAVGIPLLVIPLVTMAVASYFILSPGRRRVWIGCSVVAALVAVILGIPYIFPVGFLVYAVMRANKIEGPVPGSRAARALEAQRGSVDDPVDGEADED